MNEVQFCVFLNAARDRAAELMENAQAADASRFDFISIQDHPYATGALDTLASIGVLLGSTERIRLITDVANLPLRPPAMLAKSTATIDVLSGGRFELGLGGGRAWEQIAGLGGPTWTGGEIVRAVDDAITILRYMWFGESEGLSDLSLLSLGEAETGPEPAHRIGIWLGGRGPRMLRLLGRRADGWFAPLSTGFETKPEAQDRIDRAARQAGRDPTDVRRVIQLVGSVTSRSETRERPRSGPGAQAIRATPEVWAQIITELVIEERFDTVNFLPQDEAQQHDHRTGDVIRGSTAEQIAAFGDQVIPLALASIASRRAVA